MKQISKQHIGLKHVIRTTWTVKFVLKVLLALFLSISWLTMGFLPSLGKKVDYSRYKECRQNQIMYKHDHPCGILIEIERSKANLELKKLHWCT